MRAESDPETAAGTADDRERLVEALAELPDQMRMVVVLRDVYDLPHEDIARELGISQTAAKVRLHRARRRLREQLFPASARAGTRPAAAFPWPVAGPRPWLALSSRRGLRRASVAELGPKRRTGMQLRFEHGLLAARRLRRFRWREPPRARGSEVTCAEVAVALPSILDGGLRLPTRRSSTTSASACAASASSPSTASCCACSTSCAARGGAASRERWRTCSAPSSRPPNAASSVRR